MDSIPVDEKTTALVVEVRGINVVMLEENYRYRYTPPSPKISLSGSVFTRDNTPLLSAEETTKGFLALPWSPGHEKDGYIFGRGEPPLTHVQIPSRLGKSLSASHFRIHLNKHKIWMLESLSRNGTMYRGMLPQSQQRALHPEEPNEIRIGDLELIIYTPTAPLSLEYTKGYKDFSIRLPTSQISESVASLSVWSQGVQQTFSSDIREYHVCRKQPILALQRSISKDGDDVNRRSVTVRTKFAAIGIQDGRPYIIKYYLDQDHEQRQFARINALSKKCHSIISYLDYIPDQRAIITDRVQGVSLERWMEDHVVEPDWISLVYGHIVDALAWLEERDIIHRDVQPATIIVSSSRAWLSGFSEFIETTMTKSWCGNPIYGAPEVSLGDLYDTRADVYSLSKVFLECLSEFDSGPQTQILDPEMSSLVALGINSEADGRMSASQIKNHLRDLIGERVELPFRWFGVAKTRHLVRRTYNQEDWIRASDLIEAIPDSRDLAIVKNLCKRCKIVENEKYLTVEDAKKLCSHFKLKEFHSSIKDKDWTRTHGDAASIFYHAPSKMYNISQLFKIAGSEAVRSVQAILPKAQQEVMGVREWEGTYVDWDTFKAVAKKFKKEYGIRFDSRDNAPNETLAFRFSNTVAKDHIILVTRDFKSHMLKLRRKDCHVDWNPYSELSKFLSVEESLAQCEKLNLLELKEAILSLQGQPRTFEWPPQQVAVEVEYDSELTDVLTDALTDESD